MSFDVTDRFDVTEQEFEKMWPDTAPGTPVCVSRIWYKPGRAPLRFSHYPVFPVYHGGRVVLTLCAETLVCESRA